MRIGYRARFLLLGLELVIVMGMILFVQFRIIPDLIHDIEQRAWTTANYFKKVCPLMPVEGQQKMFEELVIRQSEYAYVIILDPHAQALVHSDPSRIGMIFDDKGTMEAIEKRQEIRQIYKRDMDEPQSPHHGERVIDILTPYYNAEGLFSGMVNLGISLREIDRIRALYYRYIAGAALILFFLLLFIDWRFQRNVVKPLNAVLNATHQIREGRFKDVLASNEQDELGVLSRELDIMARESSHLLNALSSSEESLRKQVAYLNTLLENLNEIFFTYDSEGRISYANHKFYEMTGLDWKDVLGTSIFEFLSDEQREKVRMEINNRLHRGISSSYELHMVFPDGNSRCLQINSAPIIEEGEFIGGMVLAGDVTLRHNAEEYLQGIRLQLESRVRERTIELEKTNTVLKTQIMERKQVEEALRRSEEKFSAAFRVSPESIAIVSLVDGRYLEVNDSWLLLGGYESEEVLGRTSLDLNIWVDYSLRTKAIEMVRDKKTIHNMEAQFRRKEGTIIDTLCSFTQIILDDEPCILFLTTDITERKQLEKEMLKASKLESLGVLAGGIAHDFNNLLTVIVGNIALARLLLPEEGDEISELLTEAEKASFQARGLTQQLLTFSKGGAPIRQTTRINDLIYDSAGFALRGSRVSSEFNLADDLNPVDVDEVQLSQVINNIILNAVQAMPNGGKISLRAYNLSLQESEQPSLPAGKYVCIEIEDQGIGIEQDLQNRIFDPFFTTKNTGTGLGLATSYSIIHKHDGYIDLRSKPGYGTTFYIYLPASSKEAIPRSEEYLMDMRGSGRILVMDDEIQVRDVAAHILRSLGYEVDTAADGREALAKYQQAMHLGQRFDAVITDLTVPGGWDGKQTVQEILKIDPEAKVIVSSGYSNDPVMADYERWGFKGMIGKPYTLRALQAVLQGVINSAAGQQ